MAMNTEQAADGGCEPDFATLKLITDPEEAQDAGEPPFASTDPVISVDEHGQVHVLGGFGSDSMASLEVEPSAEDTLPGDEALAEAVLRALREDASTTSLPIDVSVRRGIVHLQGRVPGLEDDDNAEAVAGRVPGIREVVDGLEIRDLAIQHWRTPDAPSAEMRMISNKTDVQLQKDVLGELRWDARVNPSMVGVTVDDGIVTLAGTVGSYAERMAADEAAHRVNGVCDVANTLEVRLPDVLQRTDTDIARAVRWSLEWDVFVPDERLQSSVSNGWVTLVGTVDKPMQRADAERAVRNLAGVRGVTNDIIVAAEQA